MEKREQVVNPDPQPRLFAENELDSVKDEKFKDFLCILGDRAVVDQSDECLYVFPRTLQNMSSLFIFPKIKDPDERVRRQMLTVDTLKRFALFDNAIRGARTNRRSVVNKENLLMGMGYLYSRDQLFENARVTGVTMRDYLENAVLLWGEHSMAAYTQNLLDMPLDQRFEKIGKKANSLGKRNTEPKKMIVNQPVNLAEKYGITPEEKWELLKSVDTIWLKDLHKLIMNDIKKSPSTAYRVDVDWGKYGVHEIIGEVIEDIRRKNLQFNTALDKTSLEHARDGIEVAIGYMDEYKGKIDNLAILEFAIKKALSQNDKKK